MNFYKHHLGDYDGATAHLSWEEDMAYTRLLRAYYRREKPLPVDPVECCRLVRATSKTQRAAVSTVLAEFFAKYDDGWHNKRADGEIAAYQAQASTNRRIARERFVNGSLDGSSTKGLPNHKPEPEPLTKTPLPPSGAFLKFWTSWPATERKESRGKCWELWRKSDFDQEAEKILSHVEALKSSERWRNGFISAPLVYLNQRRWEGAEGEAGIKVDL